MNTDKISKTLRHLSRRGTKSMATNAKENILVTGGAGYIGSHTCVELIEAGYRVTVIDNLDNSSNESLIRVRGITKCDPEDLVLESVDLLDLGKTEKVFKKRGPFAACIHFAGLKAVGESVQMPLHYYANNLSSTLNLVHLLDKYDCRRLAFSSSATVYGDPEFVPLTEDHPLRSTNPYGKTKLFIEEILRDVDKAHPGDWSIALLRYFNPIGAHPSGLIGEDPKGKPNNLVPFVAQVAVGRREKLSVFGNDYDTVDGTGVRDYIHVVDLAKGHVAAVKKVISTPDLGAEAYNLGTGHGTSVLQVVQAFEAASGRKIPYEIVGRRAGDIATCYADATKAKEELGWEAKLDMERMCEDGWRWQSNNPNGFRTKEQIEKEEAGKEERKCLVFQMYGNPSA